MPYCIGRTGQAPTTRSLRRRAPRAGVRRGVTLVELLVALSIISLLVGITLPAVQRARESSRRVVCANNLKQIGLGIHQHHEHQRTFPISVGPFDQGPRPWPQRSGIGWITRVLPFVESQPLYQQLTVDEKGDFFSGGGLQDPRARAAMTTLVGWLECPSDPSTSRISSEQWQWEGVPVAVTSYKGVLGDSRLGDTLSQHGGREPDCHRTGPCSGIFYRVSYQRPIRLADVRDGTSNTLLVGEDVPEENHHSAAFYANGDWASCHGPINYFPKRPNDWWDVVTFRSGHPGGAQFCLADGAVRFVSEDIDQTVYRALSTKAGRENSIVAPW
jgi:prepilin-type N-terminal cleavage/methylation domain-containing protein